MENYLKTKIFIEKSNKIHGGKYDYSKVDYINYETHVTIICDIHGEFLQAPSNHLRGCGCQLCSEIIRRKTRRKTTLDNRPDLSHVKSPPQTRVIPVGSGGKYAIVDEEDYENICSYAWRIIPGGYAHNSSIGLMHRLIIQCPQDMNVDHINHDVLDNRKSNLRLCYHIDNMKNREKKNKKTCTSKYKGVHWYKNNFSWSSRITANGKRIHLGYFKSETEAAIAYDEAAKKLHGEFAYLNFK